MCWKWAMLVLPLALVLSCENGQRRWLMMVPALLSYLVRSARLPATTATIVIMFVPHVHLLTEEPGLMFRSERNRDCEFLQVSVLLSQSHVACNMNQDSIAKIYLLSEGRSFLCASKEMNRDGSRQNLHPCHHPVRPDSWQCQRDPGYSTHSYW